MGESTAIPIAVVATINTLFIFEEPLFGDEKIIAPPNTKTQCRAYFLSRLLRLATKLRLAPSTRLDTRTVERFGELPEGPKPWDAIEGSD